MSPEEPQRPPIVDNKKSRAAKKWGLGCLGLLALVVVLGICSSLIDPEDSENGTTAQRELETAREAPAAREVVVDWENHSPAVRERIDDMAARRDCSGLQNEFDTADANDLAQRNRTGDGNGDLMRYIHEKMNDAECYE